MSEGRKNQDPADIVSPPLSILEEDGKDAERQTTPPESSYKDKGVHQSELFDAQKLMNGLKSSPLRVKQYAQNWRRYICNYSEMSDDDKVYVKVDGAFHLISNVLFNDESEHAAFHCKYILVLVTLIGAHTISF